MLKQGSTHELVVQYHGNPVAKGRFGGMSFELDPAGRPWIFTADEDDGCSIYWPCKDQWRDEPQDGMDISVAVPNALTDISNGRFVSKVDLSKTDAGYSQWNWHVSYPINSYDVALNIGAYAHFSDTYTSKKSPPLTMDFYALPEDLDKAKLQFAQAKGMLDAFEHYFGEYPFARDGYKLIQVPYAGMEHQSAVAYGNGFDQRLSQPRLDRRRHLPAFRLHHHPRERPRVVRQLHHGRRPRRHVDPRGLDHLPRNPLRRVPLRQTRCPALRNRLRPQGPQPHPHRPRARRQRRPPAGPVLQGRAHDQHPAQHRRRRPALVQLLHDFYQHFKYQNILTPDVIAWWNAALKQDLTPFFQQYLLHTAIPCLELNFDEATGTVLYKWQADEPGFAMPVQAGDPAHWTTLHPTRDWQVVRTPLTKEQFQVATDLFYINVSKT